MKYFLLFALLARAAEDHDHDHEDDHDHEEHAWHGTYELHADEIYSFSVSKTDEKYPAPTITLVTVVTGDEGLTEDVEEEAEHMLEDGCQMWQPGMTITVPSCRTLVMDDRVYLTMFPLVVNETYEEHHEEEEEDHDHERRRLDHEEGHEDDHDHDHEEDEHEHGTYVTMFMEYDPEEWDVHFLKDDHGHDIEVVEEEGGGGSSGSSRGKAWRRSLLAGFLVLACTMIGAIFRLPLGTERYAAFVSSQMFLHASAALSTGALLAISCYLMWYEAVHLIGERWQEETQGAWRFGTMIIAGFAACAFGSYFTDFAHEPAKAEEREADVKEDKVVDKEADDAVVPAVPAGVNWSFVMSIFGGDFLHNFVDGLVIAQAFLDCKASRGWTVAAATIYHELAQELSDFALLITIGNLTVPMALLVNVLSGTSVIFGVVTYMATKPGAGTQGLMLAFAGGTYVYLAATQAASHFLHCTNYSFLYRLQIFMFFALGVVGIGLVLLDHEHCTGSDSDGGGHGHGHAH